MALPLNRPLSPRCIRLRSIRARSLLAVSLVVGSLATEQVACGQGSPLRATAAVDQAVQRPQAIPALATSTPTGPVRTPIRRTADAEQSTTGSRGTASPWGTLVVLGGIIGLVLVGGRWIRRAAPERFAGLPHDAIELLGTRPITPQAGVHVVRVGERLLILGSGSDGLRTLSEITDPAEVAHLSHLCRDKAARSSTEWNLSRMVSAFRGATNGSEPISGPEVEDESAGLKSHRFPARTASRVAVWTLFAAGATNAVIAQEQSDVVRGTPYSAIPALNRTSLPGERDHGPVRRPGDAATTELLPTWAGPPPVESLPTWSGPSPVTLTRQERGSPTLTAFATDTVRPSDGTTNHSPVVGEAGTQAAAVDGRLNASNPQSWPHFHRVEKAVFESPAPDGVAPTEQSAGTGVSAESASPLSLELASPQGLSQTLRLGLLVGVMSLAPAILLMTTCYVRVIVVLGLLRQAIGAQQFPPTQVLTALSLFLTALVMWPVWERCYREGIQPYTESASKSQTADFQTAFTRTAAPVRSFMSQQIEATGNTAAIDLLMEYQAAGTTASTVQPEYYEEVPLQALLPAYVLSELKTAFLIGFQIYLPFVVIDLVVSSVLASLGLGMLSPAVVSLPFKLLLFVLIDGWFLTVELLLQGIPPLT